MISTVTRSPELIHWRLFMFVHPMMAAAHLQPSGQILALFGLARALGVLYLLWDETRRIGIGFGRRPGAMCRTRSLEQPQEG